MRKEMGYQETKITVKQWVYLIGMVVLNLSLAAFFLYFYGQTDAMYILKRVGLAVFVCGIMPVDLKHYRIPNTFILTILIWRILCLVSELIMQREGVLGTVLQEIIGVVVFFGVIGLCMLVAQNSIGMGDLKLVLVMAACQGLYGVMNTLFIAMIIAFFVAIVLLLTKKKQRKDTLAFAPCIMSGLYASLFLMGV
ncbi:MAG: prepilin peptidase [Lachnospiraceae bacterium]